LEGHGKDGVPMVDRRGARRARRRAVAVARPVVRAIADTARDTMMDPFWAQLAQLEDDERAPLVDIQDRGGYLVVVAEMPGIPKDKVKVEATEDRLDIRGENVLACELDVAEYSYLCNERTQTNFHRVVPLPEKVVPDDVTARIADGVLVVNLPKQKPKGKEKSVPVKIA